MLKGINPLMTPELLTALARMGHGATVAVHTQEAAGADHTIRWGRVTATEMPLLSTGTARTDIEVSL